MGNMGFKEGGFIYRIVRSIIQIVILFDAMCIIVSASDV